MHEFGDGNVTKHISPPGTLFGIDKFHERTGAQSQIFHSSYRKRNMLLHQTMQTATGSYHIHPWQFLVEIAQHSHRLRLFLYLVNKQKDRPALVLNDMVLQTEILPDIIDIAETSEYPCVILFQIQRYKRVEFFSEFPHQRGLSHLPCSSEHEGFAMGIVPPPLHLLYQISCKHIIHRLLCRHKITHFF